jgi:hypothetical protein
MASILLVFQDPIQFGGPSPLGAVAHCNTRTSALSRTIFVVGASRQPSWHFVLQMCNLESTQALLSSEEPLILV